MMNFNFDNLTHVIFGGGTSSERSGPIAGGEGTV